MARVLRRPDVEILPGEQLDLAGGRGDVGAFEQGAAVRLAQNIRLALHFGHQRGIGGRRVATAAVLEIDDAEQTAGAVALVMHIVAVVRGQILEVATGQHGGKPRTLDLRRRQRDVAQRLDVHEAGIDAARHHRGSLAHMVRGGGLLDNETAAMALRPVIKAVVLARIDADVASGGKMRRTRGVNGDIGEPDVALVAYGRDGKRAAVESGGMGGVADVLVAQALPFFVHAAAGNLDVAAALQRHVGAGESGAGDVDAAHADERQRLRGRQLRLGRGGRGVGVGQGLGAGRGVGWVGNQPADHQFTTGKDGQIVAGNQRAAVDGGTATATGTKLARGPKIEASQQEIAAIGSDVDIVAGEVAGNVANGSGVGDGGAAVQEDGDALVGVATMGDGAVPGALDADVTFGGKRDVGPLCFAAAGEIGTGQLEVPGGIGRRCGDSRQTGSHAGPLRGGDKLGTEGVAMAGVHDDAGLGSEVAAGLGDGRGGATDRRCRREGGALVG